MNGSSGIVPTMEIGNGYGNNGFFGGDGIWIVVLLALMGWGNNGFGGNGFNGFNNIATTDYISSEFTQRDINSGFQNTNNLIAGGFSDLSTNLCNVRSDILTGNMGLQNAILDSKYTNAIGDCNIQRDILSQTNELNTNLLTTQLNAQAQLDKCCCDLRAEGLANTQKILDAINTNTIQDLRDKLATANNQLSDQAVISAVRPYPVPSYLVSSPYSSIYNGFGWNNGFYGNGFFGNTIV